MKVNLFEYQLVGFSLMINKLVFFLVICQFKVFCQKKNNVIDKSYYVDLL